MIYVGSLSSQPDRDSGWVREFRRLGWDVYEFSTLQPRRAGLLAAVRRRFSVGPVYKNLQAGLVAAVDRTRPEWVHFRLPVEFDRRTIREIKRRCPVVTQYFNDDAFSRRSPFGLHWKFRNALGEYDGHFVYREHNVPLYTAAGCAHVEHCPPTYDPERHIRQALYRVDEFVYDAAFIGHWEDDWRTECLEALLQSGFRVAVRGGGAWNEAIRNRSLAALGPVTHAFGPEYNRIYSASVAGLCFFSKINRDSWTERALEIVAVGGVLVCERTREAQSFFKDGEEAFFFSSIPELVRIVQRLKLNPALRARVCDAGYARLKNSRSTIGDRAAQVDAFVRQKLHREQHAHRS